MSLDLYTQAEGLHLNEDVGQHLKETAPLDSDSTQRVPTKQSEEGFRSLILNTQTDEQLLNQNVGQPLEEIAPLNNNSARRTTTKHSGEVHTADTSLEDSSYVDNDTSQNAEARNLAMTYSSADSEGSALKLVYQLRPEWETTPGTVSIIRFIGGIMNTVCFFLQHSHSF